VRIVTKVARYGIKLYVIIDAVKAYVLQVVIYTGKSTYYSAQPGSEEDKMKTVKIVEKLVEPFVGSYRTFYMDRFYTSLELARSLATTTSTWKKVGRQQTYRYQVRVILQT
jgi:Transposase IS4